MITAFLSSHTAVQHLLNIQHLSPTTHTHYSTNQNFKSTHMHLLNVDDNIQFKFKLFKIIQQKFIFALMADTLLDYTLPQAGGDQLHCLRLSYGRSWSSYASMSSFKGMKEEEVFDECKQISFFVGKQSTNNSIEWLMQRLEELNRTGEWLPFIIEEEGIITRSSTSLPTQPIDDIVTSTILSKAGHIDSSVDRWAIQLLLLPLQSPLLPLLLSTCSSHQLTSYISSLLKQLQNSEEWQYIWWPHLHPPSFINLLHQTQLPFNSSGRLSSLQPSKAVKGLMSYASSLMLLQLCNILKELKFSFPSFMEVHTFQRTAVTLFCDAENCELWSRKHLVQLVGGPHMAGRMQEMNFKFEQIDRLKEMLMPYYLLTTAWEENGNVMLRKSHCDYLLFLSMSSMTLNDLWSMQRVLLSLKGWMELHANEKLTMNAFFQSIENSVFKAFVRLLWMSTSFDWMATQRVNCSLTTFDDAFTAPDENQIISKQIEWIQTSFSVYHRVELHLIENEENLLNRSGSMSTLTLSDKQQLQHYVTNCFLKAVELFNLVWFDKDRRETKYYYNYRNVFEPSILETCPEMQHPRIMRSLVLLMHLVGDNLDTFATRILDYMRETLLCTECHYSTAHCWRYFIQNLSLISLTHHAPAIAECVMSAIEYMQKKLNEVDTSRFVEVMEVLLVRLEGGLQSNKLVGGSCIEVKRGGGKSMVDTSVLFGAIAAMPLSMRGGGRCVEGVRGRWKGVVYKRSFGEQLMAALLFMSDEFPYRSRVAAAGVIRQRIAGNQLEFHRQVREKQRRIFSNLYHQCLSIVAEFFDDYSIHPKPLALLCCAILGQLTAITPLSPSILTEAPPTNAVATRAVKQSSDSSVADWRISSDTLMAETLLTVYLTSNIHISVAAYAAQELLKYLGFHKNSSKGRILEMYAHELEGEGSPHMCRNLEADEDMIQQLWLKRFGVHMRSTLEPYRHSEYSKSSYMEERIHTNLELDGKQTYDLKYFLWWLLSRLPNNNSRLELYKACSISVVHIPSLLSFILPHLVESVIRYSTLEVAEQLGRHLNALLSHTLSEYSPTYVGSLQGIPHERDPLNHYATCQAIFSLVEKLARWRDTEEMGDATKLKSKYGGYQNYMQTNSTAAMKDASDSSTINHLLTAMLNKVPNLTLATATVFCGAFARGLILLEKELCCSQLKNVIRYPHIYIDELDKQRSSLVKRDSPPQPSIGKKEVLRLLRDLYSGMDDTDGVLGALQLDEYSVEREVYELEYSYKWKEACEIYNQMIHKRYPKISRVGWSGWFRCVQQIGPTAGSVAAVRGDFDMYLDDSIGGEALMACWKLCQWDALEDILKYAKTHVKEKPKSLDASPSNSDRLYFLREPIESWFAQQFSKMLFALHQKQYSVLNVLLDEAYRNLLKPLGAAQRESYERAYHYVEKLHILSDFQIISEASGITLHPPMGMEVVTTYTSTFVSSSSSSIKPQTLVLPPNSPLQHTGSAPELLNTRELYTKEAECSLSSLLLTRASSLIPTVESALLILGAAKVTLEETGHYMAALQLAIHLNRRMREEQMNVHIPGGLQTSTSTEVLQEMLGMQFDNKEINAVIRELRIEESLNKLSNGNNRAALRELSDMANDNSQAFFLYTKYSTEAGMHSPNVAVCYFEEALRRLPENEGVHFEFARYLDKLIDQRLKEGADDPPTLGEQISRRRPPSMEKSSTSKGGGKHSAAASSKGRTSKPPLDIREMTGISMKWLFIEMVSESLKYYANSIRLGSKSTYHSLNRILSLLFAFCTPTSKLGNVGQLSAEVAGGCVVELLNTFNQVAAGIPTRLWYTVLPQLVSRHHHEYLGGALIRPLMAKLMRYFPHHSLWYTEVINNPSDTSNDHLTGQKRSTMKKKLYEEILRLATSNSYDDSIVSSDKLLQLHRIYEQLFHHLHFIALDDKIKDAEISAAVRYPGLCNMFSGKECLDILIPSEQQLGVCSSPDISLEDGRNLVKLQSIDTTVVILLSKQNPKLLKMNGSDGMSYTWLVKNEKRGDLRKDMRLMEFAQYVNHVLRLYPPTLKRNIQLRTFSVLPVSEVTGIIEWVPNVCTMRSLIHNGMKQTEKDSLSGIAPAMKEFAAAQREKNTAACYELFEKVLLKKVPPILQRIYMQLYQMDPSQWYAARLSYIRTMAAWSMVGYLVGLGDRHLENILVDRTTGGIVHVDFDCLFSKGFELEVPEIVPFRLTQNFVAAMGITGVEGGYRMCSLQTMRVLRDNKDMLLSVLMSFVHDPLIEWTKTADMGEEKARNSIVEISQKLNGMVNVGAMDLPSDAPKLSADKLKNALFIPRKEVWHKTLAAETQVDELIRAATCSRNLSQMYVGWMPWF